MLRVTGFLATLAVMVVSIIFGVVLGARVSTNRVVYAAPEAPPLQLAPATNVPVPTVSFADIVERSLPAVVGVTSVNRGDDPEGSSWQFFEDPFFRRFFGEPEDRPDRPAPPQIGAGSGFVISPDGYVMTNNHVIDNSDRVEITLQDGTSYQARVVGTDPSIDLALLKVDTEGVELPTLPLGDSEHLRVGEWVIAIGNPLDFQQTVTVGVVSGKNRRVPLPSTDPGVVNFIQTDAAINLGNSGGPLLDASGNVIGINTAIRRQNFAEGIGFAVPINLARSVVDQLRRTGEVRRGFIGIMMNDAGVDDATREYYGLTERGGVLVNSVNTDGPAAAAGVQAGDIILEVDGESIRDNADLIARISSRQPGEPVRVKLFRGNDSGGEILRKKIVLGDRGRDMARGVREPEQPETERPDEPETAQGLGITVKTLGDRDRQRLEIESSFRGLLVVDVDFESEAGRKGLQPDMVIVRINDREIRGVGDWERRVLDLAPGSPVKLDVVQAIPRGQPRTLYIFLRVPGSN